MKFGKITIHKSVRHIPITEKTKENEIKPKTTKTGSNFRKQNKNISQNSKKFIKDCKAGEGLGKLTK